MEERGKPVTVFDACKKNSIFLMFNASQVSTVYEQIPVTCCRKITISV